jgi:predicted transcriptional regulator
MTTISPNKPQNKELFIKIRAPHDLKNQLQSLAQSRNVSISAMARIALTDYIKRNK